MVVNRGLVLVEAIQLHQYQLFLKSKKLGSVGHTLICKSL